MTFKTFTYSNDKYSFEIKEDLPGVGYYLYVYDQRKKCIEDHLQDTEKMVKEFAKEKFQIPFDAWTEPK